MKNNVVKITFIMLFSLLIIATQKKDKSYKTSELKLKQ